MMNIRILPTLTAALGFAAATHAATVRHFWNFEGGFADQAGSADGTAGAQVTTGIGHDGNTAASFPGTLSGGGAFTSAGYVDLDQSQTWSPGTDAFSMSFWFRIADDGGTNPRGLFDFGGNGGDGPQSLYIGTSGNLAFRIDGLSGGQAVLVPVAEDDLWHFAVANYTPGSGIELHLDGAGVDGTSATLDFGNVTFDPDQYLGAFNVDGSNAARGLDGLLDDVALYEGTLDSAQIDGLFNRTLSPLQIPEPAVPAFLSLAALAFLRRRR